MFVTVVSLRIYTCPGEHLRSRGVKLTWLALAVDDRKAVQRRPIHFLTDSSSVNEVPCLLPSLPRDGVRLHPTPTQDAEDAICEPIWQNWISSSG